MAPFPGVVKASPPPVVKPPDKAAPSWTIPGPIMLTASEPEIANDHRGDLGAIARIVVPGVAPVWEVTEPAHGFIAQIEGNEQIDFAYEQLKWVGKIPHRAIVGIGNTPGAVKKLGELGVNVYFIELNPQADWEPYGNSIKMRFQAQQDGWDHVGLSYGVYGGVGLGDIRDYVPMVTDDGGKTWHRAAGPQKLEKDCLIFSADGMGDTNSWPTLGAWARGGWK